MIELYGARTGNCLRVAVALEEAGLPYRVRRVDLRRGEHLEEPFLTLNPGGRVPVIVQTRHDGGSLVMSQSNAILLHLSELAPGSLLPTDDAGRALALQRFFFVLTDVIGPSHAAFRIWGEGAERGAKTLVATAVDNLSTGERLLKDAPFLAGAAFGLADIAALTVLPSVLTEADLDRLPRLRAWYAVASERAAVRSGLRAFDPAS